MEEMEQYGKSVCIVCVEEVKRKMHKKGSTILFDSSIKVKWLQ
jgi:hypothetical protein